jgi:hypothetical protein
MTGFESKVISQLEKEDPEEAEAFAEAVRAKEDEENDWRDDFGDDPEFEF